MVPKREGVHWRQKVKSDDQHHRERRLQDQELVRVCVAKRSSCTRKGCEYDKKQELAVTLVVQKYLCFRVLDTSCAF